MEDRPQGPVHLGLLNSLISTSTMCSFPSAPQLSDCRLLPQEQRVLHTSFQGLVKNFGEDWEDGSQISACKQNAANVRAGRHRPKGVSDNKEHHDRGESRLLGHQKKGAFTFGDESKGDEVLHDSFIVSVNEVRDGLYHTVPAFKTHHHIVPHCSMITSNTKKGKAYSR